MVILIQSPERSRECFYSISERRGIDHVSSYCYFVGEFIDAESLNNRNLRPYHAVSRHEYEEWILYWSLRYLAGCERSATSFTIPAGHNYVRELIGIVRLLMKGEISL